MEFLEMQISFKQLATVLTETRLDRLVQKFDLIGGRFTLFAPTDMAFDQFGRLGLLRSKVETNPDPERQKKYVKFMKYHLVKDLLSKSEMSNLRRAITTEAGTQLLPADIGEILFSITLKNGIVHVIKKVLIDPDLKDYLYPKNAP
jgi:uncharacterized surface protein with fasciclin (FAS1) repeats